MSTVKTVFRLVVFGLLTLISGFFSTIFGAGRMLCLVVEAGAIWLNEKMGGPPSVKFSWVDFRDAIIEAIEPIYPNWLLRMRAARGE
jgi:hypothetical protein